jgi:hypothetical protein
MRYETYAVGHDLVRRIQQAGIAANLHDDGDLILVQLHNGPTIALYLIERRTNFSDIQHYYTANIARGWYTLCLIQVAQLLPNHNTIYAPDDWMRLLLGLHHNQIYAYDAMGMRTAFFFPVHFYGQGATRHVRWGELIDVATLHAETMIYQGFEWHTASFGSGRKSPPIALPQDALQMAYTLLGLRGDEGLAEIKRAYRDMARRYHPDLNSEREALYKMKEINLAYKRIVGARGE